MTLFSAFKQNARGALRGRWGSAILILLIFGAATAALAVLRSIATQIFAAPFVIDPVLAARYGVDAYFFQAMLQTTPVELIIVSVSAVLSVLLLSPIRLGIVYWHYRLVLGEEPAVTEIFRYYENGGRYLRAVWFHVNLSVRCLLWAVPLYCIPGAILTASAVTLSRSGSLPRAQVSMASVGVLLSALLLVLASLLYLALINRYILAAYLLCGDEEVSAGAAIRDSVRFTKGFRFGFLWFELSFVGWAALCVLALPALYVLPYYRTSCAVYGRYIIEKNRYVPPQPTREFVVEEPLGPADDPGSGEVLESGADQAAQPPEPHPFNSFRRAPPGEVPGAPVTPEEE